MVKALGKEINLEDLHRYQDLLYCGIGQGQTDWPMEENRV